MVINNEIFSIAITIIVSLQLGISKLQINTDSQFLIKCITQWMPKWQKNGWKLSTGGDVKNKEQLEDLHKMLKKNINIKWVCQNYMNFKFINSDILHILNEIFLDFLNRIMSKPTKGLRETNMLTCSPKQEQLTTRSRRPLKRTSDLSLTEWF